MSENPEQFQEFLAAIQVGTHDDSLDEIASALDYRREVIAKRLLAAIKPGDKVRFKSNAKPKYLQGLTATVEKVDPATVANPKVQVKVPNDPKYRKYRGSSGIRCPLSIVEPVR